MICTPNTGHPVLGVHAATSTMIANGVGIVTTANELGHTNATTTANIYAHRIAMAKARAAEICGGIFSNRDQKTRRRREVGCVLISKSLPVMANPIK